MSLVALFRIPSFLKWAYVFLFALPLLVAAKYASANELKCATSESWNTSEKELYLSLCRGVTDNAPSAKTRKKTEVSSKFVEAMLLNETLSKPFNQRGLRISDVIVNGMVDLRFAKIPHSVTFQRAEFDAEVNLNGATIEGNLTLLDSILIKGINLNGSSIKGSFVLGSLPESNEANKSEQPKEPVQIDHVEATGSRIDGSVSIRRVSAKWISFSEAKIQGPFVINRTSTDLIELYSSYFDNQVQLTSNEVKGQAPQPAELMGPDSPKDALNLFSARCKQYVFLNGSTFQGLITLDSAELGGLILLGASLNSISAVGAKVNGDMQLGYNGNGPKSKTTTWEPKATFDLSSATVNSILAPEERQYWPSSLKLSNFQLGNYTPKYCALKDRCVSERGWFPIWLSIGDNRDGQLQTYDTIAAMLKAKGDTVEARRVGLAKGNAELAYDFRHLLPLSANFFASLASLVGRGVYLVTIGYGHYPEWCIFWIVLVTALGAFIFSRTPQAVQQSFENGKAISPAQCIVFSFNLLVPLVRLDERNYEISFSGFDKYYFYFHRLCGWVLGSFLLATVTGLTGSK